MPGETVQAAEAVRARLAELGMNMTDLADAAGVDFTTVREFLAGIRSPRIATRGKLEAALRWPPGAIEAASKGRALRVEDLPDVEGAEVALFVSHCASTPQDKIRVLTEMMNKVMRELDDTEGPRS